MENLVELVVQIGFLHSGVGSQSKVHGIPIQRQHVGGLHHQIRRQIGNIAEQIAAGVANAAVGVHQTAHDFLGIPDIFPVIHRRNPQAQ